MGSIPGKDTVKLIVPAVHVDEEDGGGNMSFDLGFCTVYIFWIETLDARVTHPQLCGFEKYPSNNDPQEPISFETSLTCSAEEVLRDETLEFIIFSTKLCCGQRQTVT